MRVAANYSFKKGEETLVAKSPHLLEEIHQIIAGINAAAHKTKISKEKTMRGRKLYAPLKLNTSFRKGFSHFGWETIRVKCDYPTNLYVRGYTPSKLNKGAFREMDFVKERVGVELQFGKYAFMVYNVCAKMTIFHNLGYIDAALEIVPVKKFADEMSSGVSYFEQFAWDLQARGVADIDIPVLVLGVDA